MVRSLLVRGMLVGALAGLLAFVFARIFAEPLVDQAIAFERHMHLLAGDPPEPELVSRGVQSTIGLLTAVMVYSCALGGIFALVFAYANGRMGRISARGGAALLAAAGYVVLFLVPQLKYPANPPAIGDPQTIGSRTTLYFAMIAWSVLAAIAALQIGRGLVRRRGSWNATLTASGFYIAAVAVAMLALPTVDEVPDGFPASLLWQFRLASLGGQLVLLTTIGVLFGALTERQASRSRRAVGLNPTR
jgi:predicted cobalt transporter CbtA